MLMIQKDLVPVPRPIAEQRYAPLEQLKKCLIFISVVCVCEFHAA